MNENVFRKFWEFSKMYQNFEKSWKFWKTFGNFWNFLETFEIFWKKLEILKFFGNFWNFEKLSETLENFDKLLETSELATSLIQFQFIQLNGAYANVQCKSESKIAFIKCFSVKKIQPIKSKYFRFCTIKNPSQRPSVLVPLLYIHKERITQVSLNSTTKSQTLFMDRPQVYYNRICIKSLSCK